ncbi:MAG: response regulator transcription factor [Verrucomicrobia bacterium]|jgi:DNA-binding NarL/FixJ family response regulator|nr:response regulator transcription factor [Verrucomicrobiota bacterium]
MIKRVAIVEDDKGLREQLALVLKTAADVECVAAYGSAEEALKCIEAARPDVVLMDINLPRMSGIECVAKLKEIMPSVQIIILTVYEDSERIFHALRNGASGYLVKSSPPEKLLEAITDVTQGGSPMSTHIARKVVQHFHMVGPALEEEQYPLSPREQEVLELLAAGYIYKEIGDKLSIATETVRTYVKHICQKMHVKNKTEAVAKSNLTR